MFKRNSVNAVDMFKRDYPREKLILPVTAAAAESYEAGDAAAGFHAFFRNASVYAELSEKERKNKLSTKNEVIK